jgi:predicted RecA/RadA family phage recombinase
MAKNTWQDAGWVSIEADGTITQFSLVKLSSADKVQATGAGESTIGVAMRAAVDGQNVPVKLLSANGTLPCVAAGAITAGAAVYTAASGRVSATQTGSGGIVGYAKGAASAAAAGIEIFREWVVAST